MKIGIDMRMAGTQHGGIGRYVLELAKHLLDVDDKNEYYLFFNRENSDVVLNLKSKIKNLKSVEVNIRHYSIMEQIKLPLILNKYDLDLMHFPNFNVPLFYNKPFVVTVHDLIHHRIGGVKKTNFAHFAAYKKVIKHAVLSAKKIITVSEASKADLQKEFGILPGQVRVIYEGISLQAVVTPKQVADFKTKFQINKPYFLFVGVMQRNKNLPGLCQGFDYFLEKYKLDFDLVIVGKKDAHYPEIKNQCLAIKHHQNLVFTGELPDSDLQAAYRGAYAYVSASRFEGFGLPGVEAMGYGLPLAVSNIPVFNEIYENGSIYFEPQKPESIAQCLNLLAQDRLYYMQVKKKALERSKLFSWEKCANETLGVYQEVVNRFRYR